MIDPEKLQAELVADVREFVRYVDQQRAGVMRSQAQPVHATVETIRLTGKDAERFNARNPPQRLTLVTPNSNAVNSNVNVP